MFSSIYNNIVYLSFVNQQNNRMITKCGNRTYYTIRSSNIFKENVKKNRYFNFCVVPDCVDLTHKGRRLCNRHKNHIDDKSIIQVRLCLNNSKMESIYDQIIKNKEVSYQNINTLVDDCGFYNTFQNLNITPSVMEIEAQHIAEFKQSLMTYFSHLLNNKKTKQEDNKDLNMYIINKTYLNGNKINSDVILDTTCNGIISAINTWNGLAVDYIENLLDILPQIDTRKETLIQLFEQWQYKQHKKTICNVSEITFNDIKNKLTYDNIPYIMCGENMFDFNEDQNITLIVFPLIEKHTPQYLKKLNTN